MLCGVGEIDFISGGPSPRAHVPLGEGAMGRLLLFLVSLEVGGREVGRARQRASCLGAWCEIGAA